MSYRRNGFTLIELLVAMALGLIILGVVGYAFHNTSRVSSRAMALIEADLKANTLLEMIARDLANAQPMAEMVIAPDGKAVILLTANGEYEPTATDATSEFKWVMWDWSTAGTLKYGEVDPRSTSPVNLYYLPVSRPPATAFSSHLGAVADDLVDVSITFLNDSGATVGAGTVAAADFDDGGSADTRPAYADIVLKFPGIGNEKNPPAREYRMRVAIAGGGVR